MLEYLKGIKWVGNLSLEDADVLAMLSKDKDVFEHGCGGSTLIFSQTAKSVSVFELDPGWRAITDDRLKKLGRSDKVHWIWLKDLNPNSVDLIFIDGFAKSHERLKVANEVWSSLRIGGKLVFHDTRRSAYFDEAATFLSTHFWHISTVDVNAPASNGKPSNLTVLTKKPALIYEDWELVEGKPKWSYGSLEETDFWEYTGEE